jgi:hypothetical protein
MTWFSFTNWLKRANREATPRARAGRRRAVSLSLEQLEERTVPSVVFDPQFAKESVSSSPYTVINDATVYLIFWGTNWGSGQNLGPSAVSKLTNDAKAVINSPYFPGLKEYGDVGTVTYGGAWTDSSSDPPAGFNVGGPGAITTDQAEISTATINNPSWVPTPSAIYVVIPVGGSSGYNGQGAVNYLGLPSLTLSANICSVGGASNPSDGSTVDDFFTQTFSHEVAERISDPVNGGVGISFSTASSFPGYVNPNPPNVNNNPNLPGNLAYLAGSIQIGDGEQEPGSQPHYGYRLNGAKAQSFWSAQTLDSSGNAGAFIVPDGNTEKIYLQPIWNSSGTIDLSNYFDSSGNPGPNTTITGPTFTGNYNLLIIGDHQSSTPADDTITVNANDSQVSVTLDGQSFLFANFWDGGQIQNITIKAGGGSNTLTIQGVAADQKVEIDTAGSDHLVIGDATDNLSGILGAITVNGNGNTTVDVDDRGNSSTPAGYALYAPQSTTFTIDAGQLTRSAQALAAVVFPYLSLQTFTTTIQYGALASLTVDGGPAVAATPRPYHILNTSQANAVTINANGSDAVILGDASHNLAGINSVTVNGNGSTTLEVNDAGNATTPAQFASYAPVSTTFTVDAGQLTRSAVANVSLQIYPLPLPIPIANYPVTTTVGYGALASLTVDGGPPVAAAPTPYHILNTSQANAVKIKANGSDAVMLGDSSHNLSGIGSVTLNGNGHTTLEVNDAGNATTPAQFVSYTAVSTRFTIDKGQLARSAVANVSLQVYPLPLPIPIANYPITTTVGYGGLASLTVDGGPAVSLTPTPCQVRNTTGTAAVTIKAAGADTISVGSASNTLDFIQTPVSVYGNANTTLNVNDIGTATINNWDIAASSIDRHPLGGSPPAAPQITYHNLANVTVTTGIGQSFIGIESTNATTTTIVNGNNRGDEFIVEDSLNLLDDVKGPLQLHGSGLDFLSAVDSGNTIGRTYTVTTGLLQREGMASITYDGMGEFVLSTANNPNGHTSSTVNVQTVNTVFSVFSIAKGDMVTVGQNGSIAGILGELRFQGAIGQTPGQITLDDHADSAPRTVTPITLQGNDPTFGYVVGGLLPNGGRIGFLSLDATTPVSILGGTADKVFGIHDFSGAPAISLVAEPVGSTRTNMHNKLDYSAYTGRVQVILPLGMATGFASVSGIQDVAGGIGNSLLVGDPNPNILIGGTGRNVLIGGGGGDTLDAHLSTGDNILIDGTTIYDGTPNYLLDLDAIFAEWTRTTGLSPSNSYHVRYSDLTNGSGSINPLNTVNGQLILLNNQTVLAATSPDTLIASNNIDPTTAKRVHNWLFSDFDLDDVIIGFVTSSDHKTKV